MYVLRSRGRFIEKIICMLMLTSVNKRSQGECRIFTLWPQGEHHCKYCGTQCVNFKFNFVICSYPGARGGFIDKIICILTNLFTSGPRENIYSVGLHVNACTYIQIFWGKNGWSQGNHQFSAWLNVSIRKMSYFKNIFMINIESPFYQYSITTVGIYSLHRTLMGGSI